MLNTGRKETNGSVPVRVSRSYLWITNLYILVACLLNNVLTLCIDISYICSFWKIEGLLPVENVM